MTHQQHAARGGDILERWCALAEQRLDYLTEMFESGRWRRYHSEAAFLENIQEAKTAVATWRDLSTREAARDNSAVDLSWLGRGPSPRGERAEPRRVDRPQLRLPEIAEAPPLSDIAITAQSSQDGSDKVSVVPLSDASAPEFNKPGSKNADFKSPAFKNPAFKYPDLAPDTDPSLDRESALTLDIAAMQARYPLLRNAVL